MVSDRLLHGRIWRNSRRSIRSIQQACWVTLFMLLLKHCCFCIAGRNIEDSGKARISHSFYIVWSWLSKKKKKKQRVNGMVWVGKISLSKAEKSGVEMAYALAIAWFKRDDIFRAWWWISWCFGDVESWSSRQRC